MELHPMFIKYFVQFHFQPRRRRALLDCYSDIKDFLNNKNIHGTQPALQIVQVLRIEVPETLPVLD